MYWDSTVEDIIGAELAFAVTSKVCGGGTEYVICVVQERL